MAPFRRHLKQKTGHGVKNAHPSKSFHSTRLHEPQAATDVVPFTQDRNEPEEEQHDQELSEDEEEEESSSIVDNAYNSLLSSLTPHTATNKPPRKRRKLSNEQPQIVGRSQKTNDAFADEAIEITEKLDEPQESDEEVRENVDDADLASDDDDGA